MSKYGVFFGPYFPVFGLNKEIYEVNIRIQSTDGKTPTRKIPCLDTLHAVLSAILRNQFGKVAKSDLIGEITKK